MHSFDLNTLTLDECHRKAVECRDMAERAAEVSQRVMLEHIADTWDRICAAIPTLH